MIEQLEKELIDIMPKKILYTSESQRALLENTFNIKLDSDNCIKCGLNFITDKKRRLI